MKINTFGITPQVGKNAYNSESLVSVKALGHPSSVGCSNFQIHTCNTQNHHIITPFPICIMSGSSSIHTFTYIIYMYIHMITKAYHDISWLIIHRCVKYHPSMHFHIPLIISHHITSESIGPHGPSCLQDQNNQSWCRMSDVSEMSSLNKKLLENDSDHPHRGYSRIRMIRTCPELIS